MKRQTLVLLVAAVATAFAVTIATLRAEADPKPMPSAPLGLAAPGRVEPTGEERLLAARFPGLLIAVHVEENDLVTAGQILAEIDRSELEAQHAIALGTIELKVAERERLLHGARQQERQAAKARLAVENAELDLARKEHSRARALQQKGVLSAAELDLAIQKLDAETAQRDQATEAVELIEASARRDEVKIADLEIVLARAQLTAIDAMLDKTYVRSPIAGTVLKRYHHVGETVGTQPPTPLFVLGDLSHRMVRAEIDELDVARVHVGDEMEIKADAFGERSFEGRVVRIAQRVGNKTVLTDRPAERKDRNVLEALIELEPGSDLPTGLRVDIFAKQ